MRSTQRDEAERALRFSSRPGLSGEDLEARFSRATEGLVKRGAKRRQACIFTPTCRPPKCGRNSAIPDSGSGCPRRWKSVVVAPRHVAVSATFSSSSAGARGCTREGCAGATRHELTRLPGLRRHDSRHTIALVSATTLAACDKARLPAARAAVLARANPRTACPPPRATLCNGRCAAGFGSCASVCAGSLATSEMPRRLVGLMGPFCHVPLVGQLSCPV